MADVIPFPKNSTSTYLETVERHGEIDLPTGSLICATARDRYDDRTRYLVLYGPKVGFDILLSVATEHEGTIEYLRDAGRAVLKTVEMTIAEFSLPIEASQPEPRA